MGHVTFSRCRVPLVLAVLVTGVVTALAGLLLREDPNPARRLRPGGPRPDGPAEYLAWRRLSLIDERGDIPPEGLMQAKAHVDAMRQIAPIAPLAGISRGSWTSIGPGNVGGRVRSLLVDPRDADTILIGGVAGGIWRTTNGGASWTPVDDFMANLAVSTLARTPGAPDVVYAGTGEGYYNGDGIRGAGIFKSVDAGLTWVQLPATSTAPGAGQSANDYLHVNRLAISPNGSTLLAATRLGIFRSTNGGTSFTRATMAGGGAITADMGITDVDFHPTDSLRAVAGTFSGTGFYSTDGGATWNAAAGFPGGSTFRRVETAFAPSNGAIVYASVDLDGGSIYRSTNGGQTFTEVYDGATDSLNPLASQGWYDNLLAVSPTNENFVIWGGVDLYRSTNGASSFTRFSAWQYQSLTGSTSAHADHHIAVPHPGFNGTSNRTFFFGNDGGIYRANDVTTAGNNPPTMTSGWVELNNNFGVTQFYGGAGHPGTGRITGGTQDNGTLFYDPTVVSPPENWTRPFGGDGGFSAYDATDANYFYGEYVYLQLHRNTTGGAFSSQYIDGGLSDAGSSAQTEFIAAFVLDPNNPSRLLGAAQRLWRSNNVKAGTPAWETVKNSLGLGDKISAIAVAPGNSAIVYIGHNSGRVYKTINGNAAAATLVGSWTTIDDNNLTNPLPNRRITRISVDPSNNDIVYAALGGFSGDNVYKSVNGGASWTDITGPAGGSAALPDVPVRDLEVHPTNSNWLYAGTEVGIFASEDAGASWALPHDGPANAPVDELFVMGSHLVAVTHGRGMFTTPTLSAAAPTFTPPAPLTFASTVGVTITTTTAGATIRYTTDGVDPTSVTGTVYSGPVTLTATTTLKARAFASGLIDSDVTTGVYTLSTAPPGAFARTAPTNGASGVSLSPTLSWGVSAGANGYEYCYDTTNDNACGSWTSNGTSTAVGLSGLGAGTTYFWHVRATNPGGTTYANPGAAAFWSFTTLVPSAELLRPAGTLTSSTQAFAWTAGTGVSMYWLHVGTTGVGSFDLVNRNPGPGPSLVVPGLPTDGRRVYVRLWSNIAGTWWFRDYQFDSVTDDGRAWLTAPTPGQSLASTAQTFSWTPGTGATQHWLHVGTTGVGSFDLVNRNPGAGPGTVVTGLPTGGQVVYVRLWSNVGGGWLFRDYTFESLVDDGPAWLTTPTPDQTLGSTTQTFTWTPGTGVTQYWLHVGTTGAGSFDVVNRNPGAAPSTVVTGLPTDGRTLYVRVWSNVGGTWVFRDYTMATLTDDGRAWLTAPTPGQVLASDTQAFTWTPGAGVTQYWLHVGTTGVGSFDLVNRSPGAGPSTVVTGLPTDGRAIYVRLWSNVAGAWGFRDYVLTSATSSSAARALPSAGGPGRPVQGGLP